MNYTDINAKTVDQWVKDGWVWGRPIDHNTYLAALNGCWNVFLTPTKPVPHEWFGSLKNKRLLGLASGGGQQMPIFAAQGAICTVLDYSEEQLASERRLSEQEGYAIEILRADMTRPLPFADETFDIIFHPVSNCYVHEVLPIWKECFRILKHGGILLAGLDNGINFIVGDDERTIVNKLPYNPLSEPLLMQRAIEENDGVQFSHTLEEQLGGQLESGFCLTSLYEDTNGIGYLHELNIPSFWASRAVKP